ncbi:MAG: hypothetical protein PHT43_06580 [Anaerolineaceae bacterium]|nr:hypothetical protein [Anaerolineaceae bacterium]
MSEGTMRKLARLSTATRETTESFLYISWTWETIVYEDFPTSTTKIVGVGQVWFLNLTSELLIYG